MVNSFLLSHIFPVGLLNIFTENCSLFLYTHTLYFLQYFHGLFYSSFWYAVLPFTCNVIMSLIAGIRIPVPTCIFYTRTLLCNVCFTVHPAECVTKLVLTLATPSRLDADKLAHLLRAISFVCYVLLGLMQSLWLKPCYREQTSQTKRTYGWNDKQTRMIGLGGFVTGYFRTAINLVLNDKNTADVERER